VDTTDTDIKAAAGFAVGEQGRRTGFTLTLGAIESAERQNVGSISNFRMCLDYDQEGGGEHATAVVLRSGPDQYSLTSWTTAPCE
jgi:hypothetical protein